MKNKKMEKGITLIALIITIVILLILAVVAINAITKDDILGKAEDATKKYNQSVENEQKIVETYEDYLNRITGKKVSEVQNNLISKTENTTVYDAYGNKIVVPAGFKIVVNADTNNADTVTKGIVIEDCTEAETKGSQFVWIPVGKIYTDTERTEANARTITLGRYKFNSTIGEPSAYSGSDTEDTASNHNPDYGNAIARDIEAFRTSATTKGGYYIGRYEAGDSSRTENRTGSTDGTLVCKANQVPYNYITQPDASSKCQSMYSSGTFTSDLINSYAWDTAIIFIQTFETKSNSETYAITAGKSTTSTLQKTGTQILEATGSVDEQVNIYDMAGNCLEWSTETYNLKVQSGVFRGGVWDSNVGAKNRGGSDPTEGLLSTSFRPLLYVGV